jgi:hypothetical protein
VDRSPEGRAAHAVARGAEDVRENLEPERRRFVRYGPSRDKVVEEVVVHRRLVDSADLSPSETERIRQESGDITTDARDTLVNPPPTEERRYLRSRVSGPTPGDAPSS